MSTKKTKGKKVDRSKLAVRIMCLLLAILMVLGVAYYVTVMLATNVSAATYPSYIRVGLQYNKAAVSSISLKSATGFELGTVSNTSDYKFNKAKTISNTTITVSCASNAVTGSDEIAVLNVSGVQLYKSNGGALYLRAVNSGSNYVTYNPGSGNEQYDGLMQITRKGSSLSLVNVIAIDEYVKGVVPYEVYNSWPAETLRSFSILVRSYALGSLERHSSLGYDICTTTHCQVYKGRRLVNANVESAVNATKGQVVTFKGKMVPTYYSNSTGAVTVSAKDTWGSGSTYDYLKPVATPWEVTMDTWEVEYTPKELYTQLHNYSKQHNSGFFESASGSVKSIEITQLCERSSYVYQIKVTSAAGEVATITRADKIRSALGLKSANFVVGKAGSTVTRTEFDVITKAEEPRDFVVRTNERDEAFSAGNTLTVATADGNVTVAPQSNVTVATAYGKFKQSTTTVTQAPSTLDGMLYGETVTKNVEVKLGGESGNFVFNGRGWGHGVGLSQVGMRDLAKLGATGEQIISAYLTDVKIEKVY